MGAKRHTVRAKSAFFGAAFIAAVAVLALLAACAQHTFDVRVTVPAGNVDAFAYSDEEVRVTGSVITVSAGEGCVDGVVTLLPVEASEQGALPEPPEPQYLTPGMLVQFDVEPDVWYKVGLVMPNEGDAPIDAYVTVRNVDIRIS